MASQFSSYLTSPTIRLIPNPPASQPCSDTQYIVHRGLLTSKSQYLKKRTRESYIVLEDTNEETVGLFLEWLYRGDYDIPTSAIDEQEEAAEEEQHPVVMAAMAGSIGVWGYNKPATIGRSYILEKAQSEGLQSKYVSFDMNGEVSIVGAEKKPVSRTIQLPSPPMSPTIRYLKPQLPKVNGVLMMSPDLKPVKPSTVSIEIDDTAVEPQQKSRKAVITLDSILASHLALYVLSLKYQIPELAQLVLIKVSTLCESQPPCADTLVGFIRGVYYDAEETGNFAALTRGTPLRAFVAKYSTFRLEEVKTSDGFQKLLAEGGEFVVDFVQSVRGCW
ncbi:hypothetical protein L211DRAFT_837977 [Terfezia boudieri ATCC MYA-4762]|uniref:BTB domain-containing protein n=1 Tax=Terfezia boudieri ATCC MYA-4762 TaxID=1051890 RepID=A0A3N4LTV2_9PEZI|nr:hypothetical protein L211DRAFT_837977 [Terfezia boudieri ATCC MYA-4762]